MNKFKIRVKELRLSENLTQEQFGKIFGCNKTAVSKWENGTTEPDFNTLIKIAGYFKESVGYLLGTEE